MRAYRNAVRKATTYGQVAKLDVRRPLALARSGMRQGDLGRSGSRHGARRTEDRRQRRSGSQENACGMIKTISDAGAMARLNQNAKRSMPLVAEHAVEYSLGKQQHRFQRSNWAPAYLDKRIESQGREDRRQRSPLVEQGDARIVALREEGPRRTIVRKMNARPSSTRSGNDQKQIDAAITGFEMTVARANCPTCRLSPAPAGSFSHWEP